MTDQAANMIWAVGALVLVVSAFLAHRVPMAQAAKMALAWIAIFAVGLAIVSQREAIGRVWSDMKRDLFGAQQQVEGESLRVPVSEDGHFWVNAEINGHDVRLMIDSGATYTALSRETAELGEVEIDSTGFPVTLNTANGRVQARRGRAARLQIGPIVAHDLPVVVSEAFGDTDVIGMNFLGQLRGWRVEGRTLILEPIQD